MIIQSVFERDGMVYLAIAANAESSNTEGLRMSVKNWEKYCARYPSAAESVGHELNEAEYDELLRLAEITEAVLEAARILSSGDKSARELKQRLRRKFSAEASDYAVRLMERRGYLNETAQCMRIAEQAVRVKHHGPRRIKSDLMAHGYSGKAAEEAASAIPEEDYAEALGYNIDRKFPDIGEMSPAEVKKAAASLMNLGFSSGAIFDEIRRRKRKR